MKIAKCEHCGAKFDVSKMAPGAKIRCGRCKEVFTVPEISEMVTAAVKPVQRSAAAAAGAAGAPAGVATAAKAPRSASPAAKSAASDEELERQAPRQEKGTARRLREAAAAKSAEADARPGTRVRPASLAGVKAGRGDEAEETPSKAGRRSVSGGRPAASKLDPKLLYACIGGGVLLVALVIFAMTGKPSGGGGGDTASDGSGGGETPVAEGASEFDRRKAKTKMDDSESVLQLAHWCDVKGMPKECDEYLVMAHKLNKDNANVIAKLEELVKKKRETLRADDANGHYALVCLLDQFGRREQADKLNEYIIKKINKNHADANKRFGYVLFEGKWEDADMVKDVLEMRAAHKGENDLLASMSPRQREVYKKVQEMKKMKNVEFEYLDLGNDNMPYLIMVQKSPRYAAESALSEFSEVLTHLYKLFYETYGKRFDFADLQQEVMVVWVYDSAETYHQFGGPQIARGHYSLQNHEIETYNDPNGRYEVIFHEGVHQIVHRITLKKGGKDGNMFWFTEGIATYFESFKRDKDLNFVLGAVASGSWLPAIKNGVRQKDGFLPLEQFVSMVYGQAMSFPPPVIGLFYAQAWSFVHFLYNADNGKYRSKFEDYFLKEINGQGGKETFQAIFGDISAVQQEWVTYVTNLK